MRCPPTDLKQTLKVQFEGEAGIDYSGLSRELFYLLSHEMVGPWPGPPSQTAPQLTCCSSFSSTLLMDCFNTLLLTIM